MAIALYTSRNPEYRNTSSDDASRRSDAELFYPHEGGGTLIASDSNESGGSTQYRDVADVTLRESLS
jgi:hypothetical protein